MGVGGVLYAPGLTVNLLSLKELDQCGLTYWGGGGVIHVVAPNGEEQFTATLRCMDGSNDALYIFDATFLTFPAAPALPAPSAVP